MLIYEKKVEGVTHLFGTMGNLPSADDVQLTYKDNAGQEIADISAFKFFYNKANAMFANDSTRQIATDADTKINVWIGDNLVIGTIETVSVSANEIEHLSIELDGVVEGKANKGATVGIELTLADGFKFKDDTTPTATVNGDEIELTLESGSYKGSFVADEDSEVEVTADIVPANE